MNLHKRRVEANSLDEMVNITMQPSTEFSFENLIAFADIEDTSRNGSKDVLYFDITKYV